MLKVMCVVGTRPEAIKMAPVVRRLADRAGECACTLVATGQHRQMVDDVLGLFDIRADYDFDIMTARQTPTQVAAAVLTGMEQCLAREKPDWLLVQGDTTTAMTAALAGFYARTRVGHVEAGLRTYDKWQPFPEEINRAIITTAADLHFAPTDPARANLLRSGVAPDAVLVTGNTVIDALRWVASRPAPRATPGAPVGPGQRLLLVTAHRRENFGAGIRNIAEAIAVLCRRYGDLVRVVFPVHPNPNVEPVVREVLGTTRQVSLLPPLPYDALVRLMAQAYLVLTDSGGLQEEAPALGKPVLVLRDTTERPEGVAAGKVRLVGTEVAAIVGAVADLWADQAAYKQMTLAANPYGDGLAAERIIAALLGEKVQPWVYGQPGGWEVTPCPSPPLDTVPGPC